MGIVRDSKGTPEQRFWRYVDKTDGCWLWTGSRHGQGYGLLSVNRRTVRAHRFAWELLVGPIPAGYHIDHDYPGIGCGRPACVNPAHLKPVPPGTNFHNGRGLRETNTSGHQGVTWNRQKAKWCVHIGKDGKKHYGGYFADLADAIAARDALEAQLYP